MSTDLARARQTDAAIASHLARVTFDDLPAETVVCHHGKLAQSIGEFWSDTDKTLAVTYGAAANTDATAPLRRTVLLDKDGNLLLVYDPANVVTNASTVYDDCKLLFGQ